MLGHIIYDYEYEGIYCLFHLLNTTNGGKYRQMKRKKTTVTRICKFEAEKWINNDICWIIINTSSQTIF